VARLADTGIPIGWDKEQRAAVGLNKSDRVTLRQITLGLLRLWEWPALVFAFGTWVSNCCMSCAPWSRVGR
jgi:hypothetical protein